MKPAWTGVILSGGQNTRYHQQNKAFVTIGGRRMIDHIMDAMAAVFDDIIIVTHQPEDYIEFDATIVRDVLPVPGAATGIHAGLFYARSDRVFVTACDMPFVRVPLIKTVISRMQPSQFALFPSHGDEYLEPLCAAYHKDGLPLLESHILDNKIKIQRIFTKRRKGVIPESILRKADPELVSFLNINSPEEREKAMALFPSVLTP